MGLDLQKDPAILNAAYDDSRGVTARFNLNLLRRINRELGADFDLDAWEHRAGYHPERGRVEMRLRSRRAQQVTIDGRSYSFREGETIHTENSCKYTPEGIGSLAAEARLAAGPRLVRRGPLLQREPVRTRLAQWELWGGQGRICRFSPVRPTAPKGVPYMEADRADLGHQYRGGAGDERGALPRRWRRRTTSSSRCRTSARRSGTWRTRRWFFETFLLEPPLPATGPSTRVRATSSTPTTTAVGARHPRPQRGLLIAARRSPRSTPTARHVDAAMRRAARRRPTERRWDELAPLARAGPEPRAAAPGTAPHGHQAHPRRQPAPAGLRAGRRCRGSAAPRPLAWLALRRRPRRDRPRRRRASPSTTRGRATPSTCSRSGSPSGPSTNGEYLAFIGGRRLLAAASSGSRTAGATVQERGWAAPLYWEQRRRRLVDA